MNRRISLTILPLLAIVFTVGCGGDPKVTGKVTFPDGTPLKKGQVMFQKDGFVGSGNIQKDGTYSAGKQKDGDGLPPGKYQVFLTGTSDYDNSAAEQNPGTFGGGPKFAMPMPINLIANKFTAPNTSGLTMEVTSKGPNKFDIVVDPPQ